MLHFLPSTSPQTQAQTEAFVHAWQTGQENFVLTTSGSTGTPKPYTLTRARIEASAEATTQALGLEQNQTALVCLNTAYIGGKMALVRALRLGWAIYIAEPSAKALAAWPLLQPPYHASLVPLQLETALLDPLLYNRLSGMHSVLVGGAPLSPALEAQAAKVQGVAIYHTFGMTETVSHIALRRVNGLERSALYRLLPGHEAQRDARGCLAVRGPVTDGAWIQTNDRVELLSPQLFHWLGRADYTINTGGLKLQPEVLEAEYAPHLTAFGFTGDFYITARPNERLGQHVTLIVEAQAQNIDTAALQAYLAAQLPRFHTPKSIELLPVFPRTPTGKIIRT